MTQQATTPGHADGAGEWLGSAVVGVALIAAGVALALDRLDVVDVGVGELVWPVALVAAGGVLVGVGQRLRAAAARWAARGGAAGHGAELAERATAVFGEAHLTVAPRGGHDGASVPVSAVAVLGEVELVVPAGWGIRNRVTTVLGEVELPRNLPAEAGAPVVELHGLALLGSIEVTVDVRQ